MGELGELGEPDGQGGRVLVELSGGIAEVRLNRPDKHNGLDYPMFDAINDTIDRLESESALRAVVLCGEGPSFCAGLDFAAVMAVELPLGDSFERREGEIANDFQRVAYGWQQLAVPVIAALHGHCLGGGCQIALAADIRIAAPDLKLSVKEVRWGLIPDMGISRSLPRLVRADVARELVFSGRDVDASEALELGLVTRIADDPGAAAHELAADIAARSPDAIRRGKALLEQTWAAEDAAALALEETLQRELLGTPNQLEAVRAAMADEQPDFGDPS